MNPEDEEQEATVVSGGGSGLAAGQQIGPYTLRQPIGEGGFAEVFLAEQKEPVRRSVALKVLKAGMDSREILARFEAERQALALMQHPGIARILDAGMTENGRSWFAMEYVEGVPLTEYCDTNRLDLQERLELFTGVCDAVQHAHQKGIIHRDLKPSNILVGLSGGKPGAKVIDFGIAKATGPRLTEKTLFTAQGMLIGTPAYMSPEQAEMSGVDIDTRSDVYSLGILLYELLSGEPPFHPRRLIEAGYAEIQRIIREEEPQRPSTKSTTIGDAGKIAQARRLNVTTLRKRLDGDLDWIAMKALEKDRTRRYATVQELCADLGRHLANEPVSAGPPGVRYRLVKFVRRNRAGVAAAAMVLAALGAGIATTTWQWQQARKAEKVAVAEGEKVSLEKERLEKVVEFQEGTLTGLDAQQMGLTLMRLFRDGITEQLTLTGRTPQEIKEAVEQFNALAVRANPTDVAKDLLDEEILESAVATIDREITGDPVTEARLRAAVAQVYYDIGLYDKAFPLRESALALRRKHLGNEHPDTMASMHKLAAILSKTGRYHEAHEALQTVLERRREVLGDDHADTLDTIALMGSNLFGYSRFSVAHQGMGPPPGMESFQYKALKKALDMRRSILGEAHPDTLRSMVAMGVYFKMRGDLPKALNHYRDALEGIRKLPAGSLPSDTTSINKLGLLLIENGELKEAEALLKEDLQSKRQQLGDEHPLTLESIKDLAELYIKQKRFKTAGDLYTELIESSLRTRGEEDTVHLLYLRGMAALQNKIGDLVRAESYYRQAFEGLRRLHGNEAYLTSDCLADLVLLLMKQGMYGKAEPLCRGLINTRLSSKGSTDFRTITAYKYMCSILKMQGKFDEAEALMRKASKQVPASHKALQKLFGELLESIKEARKKKAAEDPDTEGDDKPGKAP